MVKQERREQTLQLQHRLDQTQQSLQDREATLEEMERVFQRQREEMREQLEDLRLQLENTERQLKSNKQFLDVSFTSVAPPLPSPPPPPPIHVCSRGMMVFLEDKLLMPMDENSRFFNNEYSGLDTGYNFL